jgi:hypothetical protein
MANLQKAAATRNYSSPLRSGPRPNLQNAATHNKKKVCVTCFAEAES